MKPSIRDQLIEKGIAKPSTDKPPLKEFIQGEVEFSRASGINEIGKTLYGKSTKGKQYKHRHGRTIIMNIKEEMGKGRRSRESVNYKIATYMAASPNAWVTTKQLASVVESSMKAVGALVSKYYLHGLLERKGEVGQKGYLYRLSTRFTLGITAEEVYLKFLEKETDKREREDPKDPPRKKATNELGSEQGGQPFGSNDRPKRFSSKKVGLRRQLAAVQPEKYWHDKLKSLIDEKIKEAEEVLGVKVEVSGGITITFKLG